MLEPVGVNVLVKPIEVQKTTPGGIIIPDAISDKEQMGEQRGEIVAVGKQCEYLNSTDVGRTAIYGRYAGTYIEHEGENYRLIDNEMIKGVI